MIQCGPAVCVLLLFAIAPASTSTMEWIGGQDLEQSCELLLDDPRNPGGIPCLAFMQGFIAGADTVEGTAIDDSTTPSPTTDETYSERAARTRLGTIRLQRIQAAKTVRFCIDDDVKAIEVVRAIEAYSKHHPDASDLTTPDVVREALSHSFPCGC